MSYLCCCFLLLGWISEVCKNDWHEVQILHPRKPVHQESFHSVHCSPSLLHFIACLYNETSHLYNETRKSCRSLFDLYSTIKQNNMCIKFSNISLEQKDCQSIFHDKATLLTCCRCFIPACLTRRGISLDRRKYVRKFCISILLGEVFPKEGSSNEDINRFKRAVIGEDITTHNKEKVLNRSQSQLNPDILNKHLFCERHKREKEKFVRREENSSIDLSSRYKLKNVEQHPVQQSLQKDMHLQQLENETFEITEAGEKVLYNDNLTAYERQMKNIWAQHKLRVEGQYAYVSIVFLVCLTLACLWCIRGFHGRHSRKTPASFNDETGLLTVEEVIFKKARYLPMFHQTGELEEVFVHDCGNDP